MLTVIRRRLREARQGRLVYLVRETRVNMRHTHQTANCLAHVKRKQQHPPPPFPSPLTLDSIAQNSDQWTDCKYITIKLRSEA